LVGHRVAVAEIDTIGLIPASIVGEMETYKREYRGNSLVLLDRSKVTRQVRIPVWVRDVARPADGLPISIQKLHDSGADMWVVGHEMGLTGPFDMNYGAADTHDTEWLCCGPVPLACIKRVMPFDGERLHLERTSELITSVQSIETYVFNWEERKWLHNPDTSDFLAYRKVRLGDRRQASDNDDDEDDNDRHQRLEPHRKRAHIVRPKHIAVLALSEIVATINMSPQPDNE
jgi:hypothetical protein